MKNKKTYFLIAAILLVAVFAIYTNNRYAKVHTKDILEEFEKAGGGGGKWKVVSSLPEELKALGLHEKIEAFDSDKNVFNQRDLKYVTHTEKAIGITNENIATAQEIEIMKKALPDGLLISLEKNLPNSILKMVDNLPIPLELPADFNPYGDRNFFSFKDVRDFVRRCSYLARIFVFEKKYDAALACLTTGLVAAHHLEAVSFDIGSKMIATALRGVVCEALKEVLPLLDMSGQSLKKWAEAFNNLAKNLPSTKRMIQADKIELSNLFNKKYFTDSSFKKNKVLLAGTSKRYRKKYIEDYYNYPLEIYDKPPLEFITLCGEHEKAHREKNLYYRMQKGEGKLKGLSLFEVVYFYIFPYRAMYMMEIHNVCFSVYRAYISELNDARRLRGAVISLSIKAYEQEFESLPSSLSALEKWIGFDLPLDPVTGKSFNYNPENKQEILSVPEVPIWLDPEMGSSDRLSKIVFIPFIKGR